MFNVCLCYTVLSVPCSLVITCWERALVCDVFLCVCYFPFMVSQVRCGTLLLIFAFFTLNITVSCYVSQFLYHEVLQKSKELQEYRNDHVILRKNYRKILLYKIVVL